MDAVQDRAKASLREWIGKHSHVALYDEETSRVLDVASGKSLRVNWPELAAFEEKTHPESGDRYLVMLFEDGRQIAFVDPGGVAFAPSTQNSGPVTNLPPVVCLRDFLTLKQRIDHFLYDHPDAPPPRECADLVMICIAMLDGARAAGFDVNEFEGDLEKSLNELEKRTT